MQGAAFRGPLEHLVRGDRPSEYCMRMYQRGITRFREAGQEQLAEATMAQLTKIQAGQGRSN